MDTGNAGDGKKVAFVLSGGGNRGAIEIGVLLALLESGIKPSILVGTSVGAINAAAIAGNPTLDGVRWLEGMWEKVTRRDVMPNNYLSMVWRLVTGESSLFTNKKLRDFLESHFPEGMLRFSDIEDVELYITGVDLGSSEIHVFGIDKTESIIDALMASTALPPFFSPWQYRGHTYMDGALASYLPLKIAVEMKATEIYAIDVWHSRQVRSGLRGILGVVQQAVDTVASQQFFNEMEWSGNRSRNTVHYISIDDFQDLRIWDFSHTREMIDRGREAGLEYIQNQEKMSGR